VKNSSNNHSTSQNKSEYYKELFNPDISVRRGKPRVFSREDNKPTRELSFHPVSSKGTVEVTTSFKYFGKRLLEGVREHIDRTMSEHRKSLEKGNADADLVEIQRRLRLLRKQDDASAEWVCRGSGDGMYVQETRRNTGSPSS